MIRLLLQLLKVLGFAAVVLWFGQTPLGESTVAGQFRLWGTRAWNGDLSKHVKQEVRDDVGTTLAEKLKKPMKWLKEAPRISRLVPSNIGIEEPISDTNRRALQKLLQEGF